MLGATSKLRLFPFIAYPWECADPWECPELIVYAKQQR